MKKAIIVLIIIIIILGIIIIPKLNLQNSKGSGPEVTPIPTLNVRTLILKPEKLDYNIFSNGSIIGNEEVELRPEVSGRVTKINFNEGQRVSANQLLVKINDAELQAQLSKAKYMLKLAEDNEARLRRLFEIEGVSRENYDIALNEVNIQKAEIDLLNAQIEKTEINAPFSGVIGLRHISEGSYVTPQTLIATLQNINPVKINFSVSQKYISLLRTGMDISFKLPPTNVKYNAKIYAIEPKVNPNTRTIDVRALAPNPDGKLLPGSFVEIDFPISREQIGYMIPTQALIPDLESPFVYLYEGGKATPRKVEIGIRTPEYIELLSGVSEGDTVIVSGIITLRPGLDVNISEIN